MFILLGYVSLTLIQLYRRYQRRTQYSGAMLRALRSGSVLVQRGKCAQRGSVGALLNSSLLSCSQSYKETQLLSDECLDVSVVSPKQQVDLGDWVSYLDLPPAQTGNNRVVALLEAGPADTAELPHLHVPPAKQVHVLKHGCPLAWKSGNPFGIILHCSYDEFVILCDAFGQGQLTLNEELQLYRMLTISTVGKPKSLKRPKNEEILPTADKTNLPETNQANTDPVCPLPSTDVKTPLYVTVTQESGQDTVRNSTESEIASTGKPKNSISGKKTEFVTESSLVKKAVNEPVSERKKVNEAGASEKSGGRKPSDPGCIPVDTSEVTRNGNAVMVTEKSAFLEESRVVNFSTDIAHDLGKNGQPLSLNAVSQSVSQSTNASDKTGKSDAAHLYAKGTSEKGVLSLETSDKFDNGGSVSSDTNNRPYKKVSVDPALNDSQEFPKPEVKDDSVSSADSQQELSLKESKSERKQHVEVSTSENVVSGVLQQHSNVSSTVSTSLNQDLTRDTERNALGSNSQQVFEKSQASANRSASSVNGNGVISTSSQNLQALQETSEEGVTKVNSNESLGFSQASKDEEEKSLQSESSSNSTNGVHDSDNQGLKRYKPPNIVIYCGKKDSARKFDIIKEGLEQCLNTSAYSVYILPHEEVMTLPWEDNSAALIISHDYLHDNIGKKFTDFLLNGGKVISFGSSLEGEFLVRKEVKDRPAITKFNLQKWRDVSAIQGRYHYIPGSLKKGNSSMDTLVVDPASSQPLVVRLMLSPENGNGKAIFSQLFLERDPSDMAADSKTFSRLKQSSKERLEVLRYLLSLLDLDTSVMPSASLTPCYLLVQDQALRKSFLDSIAGRMKQDSIRSRALTLKFVGSKAGSSALKPTHDTLPVITDVPAGSVRGMGDGGSLQNFDPEVYWRHLTTSVLGRVVMYTEVIPTTMTVFEGIQFSLPEDVGVIAVAGQQTTGKGRGGNQWLSPAGCAMFTLPLRLLVESPLGQHISFLQHIASLSMVHSIRTLPGYEDLNLRLKWPNDVYYGDKAKLGGVLVNSTIMGKTLYATVGCGINVSNSLPTLCINSIIQQHNHAQGSNLKPLTTSEVLARTVSTLETLVARFQTKGHQDFCQLYYRYWLHSGAHVKMECEGNAEVEICGLDDFGFLRVVNGQGQQLSVQPDGNSFDMLRNLITVKRD